MLRHLVLGVMLGAACEAPADDLFARSAAPVLEARCAAASCHGVAPDEPWPEQVGFFVAIDEHGRLADLEAARAIAKERIVTTAPATLSSLVRVPTDPTRGGGPHFGGAALSGPDDPATQALVAWIESEHDGGEDLELTALERQFADTVMPTLIERCGQASCHGPTDGAFARFAPHIDTETGLAAPADVHAIYKDTRKHLDLWSDDPLRSRLIRKGIRTVHGGLPHRRSRFGIFSLEGQAPRDAPSIRAVLDWADAERQALGMPASPRPTGIAYIEGPSAERLPFRIEPGPTGSDLMLDTWPPSGSPRNLTARLHPDEAVEIRDVAVSHDASRVAFAMRAPSHDTFRLWELDLASGDAWPRGPTNDRGSLVQPTYAPDGSLIAVWDGHGETGADGNGVAPELVQIHADDRLQRLTFTPAPEVTPAFLAAGKTRGQLLFATRRDGRTGPEGVMFRFPLTHDPEHFADPEYHAHFGSSLAPMVPLAARDLADGRQVFVGLATTTATDDHGRLGILDRSLGPVLDPSDELFASIEDYIPAVTWLELDRHVRDPMPLPDGRVLVAAPRELGSDVDAIFTIAFDTPDATAAVLTRIIDGGHQSLRSPVAIVPRPPEHEPHASVVDPLATEGELVFRDAAILETLYGKTAPIGQRPLRSDIASVRVLGWPALSTDVLAYTDTGTTLGHGSRPPMQVFGEWPLADDRSIRLQVPARTPLLLQWLDHDGMAIGDGLDRWYYVEGREVVSGGTNDATYGFACSGCHGSPTGRADDEIVAPPDAISSASVTLSSHRDRDPRQPIAPTFVDDEPTVVDFRHDVAPVFAQRCATPACHGGESPAAGLPLDDHGDDSPFSLAYDELTRRAVDLDTLRARKSPLMARLLQRPLDVDVPTPSCLTAPIDPETAAAVVRWIESGAAYDLRSFVANREEPAR